MNAIVRALWRTKSRHPVLLLMVLVAACSPKPSPKVLDAASVRAVIVGQSSRADVFSALGQPLRTERSVSGETWIYEAKDEETTDGGMLSTAATASGVLGAFVPYAGLAGSGFGLARSAAIHSGPAPTAVGLHVLFGENGIVRDCIYSTTAVSIGMPGSTATDGADLDCRRIAR